MSTISTVVVMVLVVVVVIVVLAVLPRPPAQVKELQDGVVGDAVYQVPSILGLLFHLAEAQ